jgi:hypothetical protein
LWYAHWNRHFNLAVLPFENVGADPNMEHQIEYFSKQSRVIPLSFLITHCRGFVGALNHPAECSAGRGNVSGDPKAYTMLIG